MITREQAAEAMTRKEIESISLKQLSHNGFDTFIIKDINHAQKEEFNAFTFWGSKFIDYVTYPDYVNNIEGFDDYVEYVKKQQREKLLNVQDLYSVKDYQDFRKKIDFLLNIFTQVFESKSIFSGEINKAYYKYKYFTKYYKNLEDANVIKKYHDQLYELYDELLKDPEKLYQALVYEFYNHETPIDWDGVEPALNALGLSEKTLTPEQASIMAKAYNYVCSHGTW